MGGKWLELLSQIAPSVKRVAAMFNPDTTPGGGSYHLTAFEAAARSLQVEPVIAPVRSDAEIEAVITSLVRKPGGGFVVMPDSFVTTHRAPIILLAAQNNVPAVYHLSVFVRDGGLLSYGPDLVDIYHRSASYVDRILRGAKPEDLPVQLPTKFEMAVNVKTGQRARPYRAAIHSAERRRGDPVVGPVQSQDENCPHYPQCCDAQAASAVGHLRRINGARAVSAPQPIAPELARCSNRDRP
jgi:ABC transporter substrate binding protein